MHEPASRSATGLVASLSLCMLLAGCASRRPAGQGEDPRQVSAELRLEHEAGKNAWLVKYALSRKVPALGFLRPEQEYRRADWHVRTPGIKLVHEGNREVLRADDGSPFDEVELEISTYTKKAEKDYQAFIPYTDGGVLVFTGVYDVASMECLADAKCGEREESAAQSSTAITLAPRAGESVVVDGRVAYAETRWVGSNEGTYVYFGKNQPVVSAQFISVVDTGMPAWLLQQTNELIPRIFAYYTSHIGQALPVRPIVYISYSRDPSPGTQSFGGGALPGVLQLETRLGDKYQGENDPVVSERAALLVAHEAAHLWNAQLNHHRGDDELWLSEGGADAFAFRALRDIDFIGDERYARLSGEAISQCLLGLEGEPLKGPARAGRSKNDYWCGTAIALITEGATRRSQVDLPGFWGKLFAANPTNGYDQVRYDRLLSTYPGGSEAVTVIHRLLDGPLAGADKLLLDTLHKEGTQVHAAVLSNDPSYERLAGLRALQFVAALDCGPSARIDQDRAGYKIIAEECTRLGLNFHPIAIGVYRLTTQGASAYDLLQLSCENKKPIELVSPEGVMHMPCDKPLAQRPLYLEFGVPLWIK